MASPPDKPRGYFEFILAFDCETTGMSYNSVDPSIEPSGKEYQMVSAGLIVANAATLTPIQEMYLEIQWNGTSEWSYEAQNIHGLTKEYLEANGFTEEEAVEAIGNLIMKYWGPTVSIRTLGHNIATFDLWFLRRLFNKFDISLNFGNRHVDLSSIGFVNWGVFNSDDLFQVCGFKERGKHNALDDARMSLETARLTRTLFNKCLDGELK